MSERPWEIPLADVLVDDEIVEAAREAVGSGWWSMGPRVAEFEEAFANSCGAAHAFAVSSGTAALHLALLACECGPGDEVVLPSLNFVAAANVVVHTGARPVFCDIRGAHDVNLDPDDVEAAITDRTKALLVLHYGGHPCDMDAIGKIAGRHGLAVIEDAAHAPGATWNGKACGTLGDVGCFSFFSNKNLPIGEGGIVVTDDSDLAERIRLFRSHGMTTLTWDRHRGHAHAYDVVVNGFNYRMDEVRAAIALIQLQRLPDANEARSRIVTRYREKLARIPDLMMPFASHPGVSAHHLAVVVLPERSDRQAVREVMKSDGVQTSVHYPPIHQFTVFQDVQNRPLGNTDSLANRIVTLPLYAHLSDAQVDAVVQSLEQALDASVQGGVESLQAS